MSAVGWFLDHALDSNIPDLESKTAFIEAVRARRVDIFRLLIHKTKDSSYQYVRNTVVHYATDIGILEMVQLLLIRISLCKEDGKGRNTRQVPAQHENSVHFIVIQL
jgi:hypothetical protein